ncbi:DUF2249 domain-containing protein [Mitsuaria sp. WAJ17]|uniref:DUF2249 domain-containing protein n=1 Tax=Mitsuaria sp. WAJ17 TaxID=2761452 RepID=UPI0015FF0A0B|nr:DUF2249 domain-containing protein [Mitsuaria sp. WAJ17]MBB2485007.1 DUF2249 domain-containing protein [Mitsuaria sp. WAJ17]
MSPLPLHLDALPPGRPTLAAVFETYLSLSVGESLEVRSAQDLHAVRLHLQSVLGAEHLWKPGQAGPGTWTATITKLRAFESCCGACG